MPHECEWWGVVTCRGWQDDEERKDRFARIAAKAEKAEVVRQVDADSDSVTIRRVATDDLNDAIRRIHDAAGVDPTDFRSGDPQRV